MDSKTWVEVERDAEKFVAENGGSWDATKWDVFLKQILNRHPDAEERQLGQLLEKKKSQYLLGLPNDLEAIKLLSDWSKWLVLVETGAISVIGALWKFDEISKPNLGSKIFMTSAVTLFGFSISAAVVILLSIPGTVQRLPPPPGKDIFHMRTFEGSKGPPLYVPVNVQAYCFIAGFIFFILLVISSLWFGPIAGQPGGNPGGKSVSVHVSA
jgi:hypothetical protein